MSLMRYGQRAALAAALAWFPLAAGLRAAPNPPPLPAATPEKLPRWRGFNLLEKFMQPSGNKPFAEADFRMISELGFNFVRLPMDYRLWIKNKNWEEFDESVLKEIDQAVEYGRKYGVHVCLNFHRAPGYTVARPAEARSLWTDPEARRVCALHWATFARRYKGIPNERLSFNLMNEPAGVEEKIYAEVARQLVEAIRKEDPNRLIISDGLEWGRKPILSLRDLRLAQATRGYTPMEISHYQASWVNSAGFPRPAWPAPQSVTGILMSPAKPEGSHPLIINGPFDQETVVRLHVATVSAAARLVAEADGKKIWEKHFQCGPGEGEWKKADFKPQWKIYQNLYDRDYTFPVPVGTRELKLQVKEGDWMQITELGFKPAGAAREEALGLAMDWGKKPAPFRFAPGAPGGPFLDLKMKGREWLYEDGIKPWKEAQAQGIGVMVGEWGAYNKTPHEVFLRWAEDCLKNWQEAGFGWALWNFRGSFGVLDSGRGDVQYEDFQGHKLDRKLMDLLQKY